ncbi:DUF72 domain-containing protein [Stutzerimonas azotifigens]|uniref:DUF72 domain-containing protein n=1 Tax=Stutzerimonas azotifigens TaxID=291995 RepID=UPI0003F5815C|nr:DUF72 domain-containing protein [Stutzerimonas azotifigens]
MASRGPLIQLGCAGWSLPREYWPAFPAEGTHLARYAARLPAVEINSSFYRPHRPETYRRWAESVPEGFRFCVKVPKAITHEARLRDCGVALDAFLAQCTGLGDKLGCLLVQLPPSLGFEAATAEAFFASLRERYAGALAFEPRHASWADAGELLERCRVARVAADPTPVPGWDAPGGWTGLRYYRLHGSPRIYYSRYGMDWLQALAQRLVAAAQEGVESWCIFDNTASGAATANVLEMRDLLAGAPALHRGAR